MKRSPRRPIRLFDRLLLGLVLSVSVFLLAHCISPSLWSLSSPIAHPTWPLPDPAVQKATPAPQVVRLPLAMHNAHRPADSTALAVIPTPSPMLPPADTATLLPTSLPTDTPTISPTNTPTPPPSATPTPMPVGFTPEPTPDGVLREARVPILMYHYISAPPRGAGPVRRDLSVPPYRFEQQLQYLQDNGYQSISFHDLIYHLTLGWPLPVAKPIILTFDDGYRDHYENAYPLLKKYGFSGHFFIATDLIDRGLPEYLTWEQIKEMAANGMEFGAHSRDHADLRGQSTDYLVWQTLGPRETIEYNLGIIPRVYSYPSGWYDENVIAVVHSAGYWAGVTIEQGMTHRSDKLFELKRIRVSGSDSLERLDMKLNYDW